MRFDLTDLQLFVHILDSGTMMRRGDITLASASDAYAAWKSNRAAPCWSARRAGIANGGRSCAGPACAPGAGPDAAAARGHGEFGAGLAGQIRLRGNTSAVREHLPLAVGGFCCSTRKSRWSCRNAPVSRFWMACAKACAIWAWLPGMQTSLHHWPAWSAACGARSAGGRTRSRPSAGRTFQSDAGRSRA